MWLVPYIITIWRGAAVLSVLQLGLDVEKELEVVGGILGDCDGGDVPSSPVDRGQGQHSGGRGLVAVGGCIDGGGGPRGGVGGSEGLRGVPGGRGGGRHGATG